MRLPVLPIPVLPRLALVAVVLLAAPAQAHTGHLGELAGHDHWVAGAALGAAVLIGLWGALKGKRKPEQTDPDPADPAVDPGADDQEHTA